MIESSRNNRTHDRVDVRTVATVVVKLPELRSYKAWTDDLSPSGARILCAECIPDSEMYLRVLLPGMQDHYLVAQRVRHQEVAVPVFRSRDKIMHSFGVVFTGIRPLNEINELLEQALPKPS